MGFWRNIPLQSSGSKSEQRSLLGGLTYSFQYHRLGQYILLKHQWISARLYGVTSQEIVFFQGEAVFVLIWAQCHEVLQGNGGIAPCINLRSRLRFSGRFNTPAELYLGSILGIHTKQEDARAQGLDKLVKNNIYGSGSQSHYAHWNFLPQFPTSIYNYKDKLFSFRISDTTLVKLWEDIFCL